MRSRNHRRLGRFSTVALGLALTGASVAGLAGPASAARDGINRGGVKVDSFSEDLCTDPVREDNHLLAGSEGIVWLNSPTGLQGTYTYEIYSRGVLIVEETDLDFVTCGEGSTFWYATFDVPGDPGTYTLVVYVNGELVSGDSFQVEAAA
jgi:hypothetical protein